MREPTHYSAAALAYARAILELAEERKLSLESVRQELNDIVGIVKSDSAFGLYVADPAIGVDERGRVIERAFSGKVTPLVYNFLRLLNIKSRLSMLSEIVDAYGELVDEKTGKIEVDLTVAHKMTEAQVDDAKRGISAAIKRDAVVHVYVDENIIGGTVIRIGDRLIDGSVKAQLVAMKERLLAAGK